MTDRQTDRQTVDCEGVDSIRYGGAMGAAADSFISRKLLMDIYIGHRWLKKLKRVQQLMQASTATGTRMPMGSHSVYLPTEITCRKSGVATTRTWNLQITSRELYQLGQHVSDRVVACAATS